MFLAKSIIQFPDEKHGLYVVRGFDQNLRSLFESLLLQSGKYYKAEVPPFWSPLEVIIMLFHGMIICQSHVLAENHGL